MLPTSFAPGVVEVRDELHITLRAALVADGDADALLSFADTAHGVDDYEIWSAALAVLPATSPRRAQVVSHLRRLDVALA